MDRVTFWCLVCLTTSGLLTTYSVHRLIECVVAIDARIEVQKQRAEEIEKFIGLVR